MTRHLMQRRYAIDVLILPSVLNGHYTTKDLAFGAGQVIVTAEKLRAKLNIKLQEGNVA
jgi:hypothetical protein